MHEAKPLQCSKNRLWTKLIRDFTSVLHNYHYVLSPLFWECPHLHLSFGTRELTNNTPTSKYATKYPPFGERGGLGPHYVRKHLPPLGGGGEEDWSLI